MLLVASSRLHARATARLSTVRRRGVGASADPDLDASPTRNRTGIPRAPGRPTTVNWIYMEVHREVCTMRAKVIDNLNVRKKQ